MRHLTAKIVILQFTFLLGLLGSPFFDGLRAECVANDEDLYRLGSTHYSRGQWKFAAQRFETLIDQGANPSLVQLARFYLAESYIALNDFNKALKHLRFFLKHNSDHHLADRAIFRIGEISYLVGDSKTAFKNLKQFATTNPHDPLLQYALPYLGEIELKKGKLNTAAVFFQSSLQKNPNGILANEARFGLARTLEKNQSSQEAIRFYQYLVDHPESNRVADSLLQLGKIRFRQNDLEQAHAAFARFDTEFADHKLANSVRYWQGRIQYQQNDFVSANTYFKQALANNPDSNIIPPLRYELARVLIQQERINLALEHLEYIASEHPDSDWADDAILLNIQVLRNSHQHQQAIRLCQQFKMSYPGNQLLKHVLVSEAECLYASGQYHKAKNAFTSLLEYSDTEIESDSRRTKMPPVWKYKLAVCQIKLGNKTAASSILKSLQDDESDETIQSATALALATIQIERNQLTEATKSLISYVEFDPGSIASQKCFIDLALLFAKRNNFQEAGRWLSRINDPQKKTETCLQLAEIAFASQQFLFASRWFAKASELTTDEKTISRSLMGNVWALKESGNIEIAIVTANRLFNSFPMSQQAPEALFLMAVLLDNSGKPQKAIKAFEQLAKSYPASRHLEETYLSLATLYRKLAKDQLVQLIDPLSDLIDHSNPSHKDSLLYELAWILKETTHPTASIQRFSELCDNFPKSKHLVDATLQLADFETTNGNIDRARQLYQTLEETVNDPEISPVIGYQLGKLAFEQSEFLQAYRHMNHVVEKHPNSNLAISARFWAAESKYRCGDFRDAQTLFQTMQTLTECTSKYQNRILLRLCQIHIKTEKWNAALKIVKQLKTQKQPEVAAWEIDFICGRANSGLGLFSKARAAYENVITNPNAKGTETAAMAQWMIGESYFHQENLPSAIDAYQRAEILHSYPEWQAASLLQAGKCFERINQFQNAIQNYRRIQSDYAATRFFKEAKTRISALEKWESRQITGTPVGSPN
ncbi:MAG: tetratricopeptide repeat protein [Planctomycetota bacterium]|nr:tetratricopeptide repeat protein [Planctomycetota bacterium]